MSEGTESWLDRFKASWRKAEQEEEVKGAIRKHSLRVQLIARMSTIDLSKVHRGRLDVLADCVQAARIVCRKKEELPDPDEIPDARQ